MAGLIKKVVEWSKKQRILTSREKAQNIYSVEIFNNKIYIACNGIPCMLVEDSSKLLDEYYKLIELYIETDV